LCGPIILAEVVHLTGCSHKTALTPQEFPESMLPHAPEEASMSAPEKTSWKTMEVEKLNDTISRQMISGENATLSQLLLKRGAVVPRHSHVNEQYSWIISGALKFVFDDREIMVSAGEVLLIPPHVPHLVVAIEDTVDVDFFAPRREDWIRKEDAYLRG
jgi:quercetin dioxygenase-like cupin family protein